MSWLSTVLGFGGAVAEPVVGYFRDKLTLASQERQRDMEFKKEVHVARLENVRQGKLNEAEWNLQSIRNSSWKDEYLTIILSIPMILCFFPSLADDVLNGFNILAQTPEWYRYLIGAMVASGFGLKQITNVMKARKYE